MGIPVLLEEGLGCKIFLSHIQLGTAARQRSSIFFVLCERCLAQMTKAYSQSFSAAAETGLFYRVWHDL